MCAVAEAVCPLASHRLVEALDLSVWLRPALWRAQVTDPLPGEQLLERAVERVAPGVVGHQPFRLDSVRGEESERASDEGGDGLRPFVSEQLGVAEARVIVDDRVRVV